MLYCPNYTCQTPNLESHKFCQKCRTPLPRHYLWAIGEGVAAYRPGDLLANRYLCKSSRIFLDTKPGLFPEAPVDLPEAFFPYLRLSPCKIHVPQIYDVVSVEPSSNSKILLLDEAAFYISPSHPATESTQAPNPQAQSHAEIEVLLLPALVDLWQDMTALRQMNWLWQIAHLWQPLSSEQVVTSLLAPELIRVEGPLVRLIELRPDASAPIASSLAQLGQLWLEWATTAKPEITQNLTLLCQQLIQGQIRTAEQLIDFLDQGLVTVGRVPAREFQIATRTDQGPSRQRNEDACYPPSGTVKTQLASEKTAANQGLTASDLPLVIVCDGIGGHQGGDVASNLAIATVEQQVQRLQTESLSPVALMLELEKAACAANDVISQRNDSENRYDRQRMGTTLVMGLVRTHELYVTHVGDSRAYWITRWGCRQITLDDDVASREVRLGYSSYREALQQPSAGSLVQALGMGPSTTLHPTAQRFILDEDSVFLFCSDGLSDNDRVEECWETTILPLLQGKTGLAAVSQQLIEIANTRNGHDNATVGLLYCRVAGPQPAAMPSSLRVEKAQFVTATPAQPQDVRSQDVQSQNILEPKQPADLDFSTQKTQILARSQPKPNPLGLLLGIGVLLGLSGLLAYFLLPSLGDRLNPSVSDNPSPSPAAGQPTPSGESSSSPTGLIQAGSFVQVSSSTSTAPSGVVPLGILLPKPPESVGVLSSPGLEVAIPSGGLLKVLNRRAVTPQNTWVQLQVCSIPGDIGQLLPHRSPSQSSSSAGGAPGNSPVPQGEVEGTPVNPSTSGTVEMPTAFRLLQTGESGWVQESTILPVILPSASPTPSQQGACAEPVTPTPIPPIPKTTSSSLS